MIKQFFTALTVFALSATMAVAQQKTDQLVIAAGMPNGGYAKYAGVIATRMAQRGYSDVIVTNHNGSNAISLAACNGQADIWIAQVDAIYSRFQEGCALYPVGDYGTEVAVLLVPPKSKIDELDDITSNTKIATDGIGSGTELFWKTIVSIENGDNGNKSEWSKAKTVESSPDMLNTMANFGDIQAAILVRTIDSPHIAMLLKQGWELAELWDKDINDEEFNSLPLYESEKIVISANNIKAKNWAYKVRSFVGVSKKHNDNRALKMDLASSVN